jgi:hypothetical protein
VLDGVINMPGVHAPDTKEICEPLRALVEKEGWGLLNGFLRGDIVLGDLR